MKFEHEPLPFEYDELDVIEKNGKRYYVTPKGVHYPSVTTILKQHSKEGIEKWRKRVGEEEANRVMHQASVRGNAIHDLCEDYVLNNPLYLHEQSPVNVDTFMMIKKVIDKRMGTVYGVEIPLYSDFLEAAGRNDLFSMFDGKRSIVDYKTARKPKKKEWCKGYFMQESAYAVAIEERFGISVTQLVTIIAVDGEPSATVYIEHRDDHIQDFMDLRNEYREKFGE